MISALQTRRWSAADKHNDYSSTERRQNFSDQDITSTKGWHAYYRKRKWTRSSKDPGLCMNSHQLWAFQNRPAGSLLIPKWQVTVDYDLKLRHVSTDSRSGGLGGPIVTSAGFRLHAVSGFLVVDQSPIIQRNLKDTAQIHIRLSHTYCIPLLLSAG